MVKVGIDEDDTYYALLFGFTNLIAASSHEQQISSMQFFFGNGRWLAPTNAWLPIDHAELQAVRAAALALALAARTSNCALPVFIHSS